MGKIIPLSCSDISHPRWLAVFLPSTVPSTTTNRTCCCRRCTSSWTNVFQGLELSNRVPTEGPKAVPNKKTSCVRYKWHIFIYISYYIISCIYDISIIYIYSCGVFLNIHLYSLYTYMLGMYPCTTHDYGKLMAEFSLSDPFWMPTFGVLVLTTFKYPVIGWDFWRSKKTFLVGGVNHLKKYSSNWIISPGRIKWGFPKMVVPNNHGFSY